MDTFQVSYRTPNGIKKISSITAFNAQDAKITVQQMVRVDNNQFFDCVILRVWKHQPPTTLQKLAQKYGYIMGGIKGAQVQFKQTRPILPNGIDAGRVNRATGLVDMQFTKLERDIRDFFKLAGLKIK